MDAGHWYISRAIEYAGQQFKPDTPDQLLAVAKPGGVSRIVLIQMSIYGTDNAYMLDAIKRYPAVFSGVGILDTGLPLAVRRQPGLIQPKFRPCDSVGLRSASPCVR